MKTLVTTSKCKDNILVLDKAFRRNPVLPKSQIEFIIYDNFLREIGRVMGLTQVVKKIGISVNESQISNNSRLKPIDKRYYVSREELYLRGNMF